MARLASLLNKKQVGNVLVSEQHKPSPLMDMLQGMDYVNIDFEIFFIVFEWIMSLYTLKFEMYKIV